MCLARVGGGGDAQPEMLWILPRNDLSVELFDRLAHAKPLAKLLAHRICRISLAEIGVLDGAFYPTDNMLGLIHTGKHGISGNIHSRFAARQDKCLPSCDVLNSRDSVAAPRRNKPVSGGGTPTVKLT